MTCVIGYPFFRSILQNANKRPVIAVAIQSANPIIIAVKTLPVNGMNSILESILTIGIPTSAKIRIGFHDFQIGTASLRGYRYAQSSMSEGRIG